MFQAFFGEGQWGQNLWLALGCGLAALAAAGGLYQHISRQSAGSEKMRGIASSIHLGAMAFLREEAARLGVFVAAVAMLLWMGFSWHAGLAFFLGACCSAGAGNIGMRAATRGNVRTAEAARKHGAGHALLIAFNSGAVMGLAVAGLGLLGLGLLYGLSISQAGEGPFEDFLKSSPMLSVISGFSMGASSIALFARVGGGIFTKAADVGSDLAGKVEAGIPEDDPRNPGVIADNVGDNVGDVAGMGADIFESYAGAMVASITLAATMSSETLSGLFPDSSRGFLMALPLWLAAAGLLASLAGIFGMSAFKKLKPSKALAMAELSAGALFLPAAAALIFLFGGGWNLFLTVLAGLPAGF